MAHHHHHDTASDLSFDERLSKRLEHWLKHNQEHADGFRQWADQAAAHQHPQAARHLEAVVALTRQIDRELEAALATVRTILPT